MAEDIYDAVVRFNADRDPALVARKLAAMAASPFAFYRGTAHLFYGGWHADAPLGGRTLGAAPATWAVGDLHLENFGSYRGDNRLTYFDINDFDEAALAPATVDLTRLLTSIRLAWAAAGFDEEDARSACGHLLSSYRAALLDGTARWVERRVAGGPVRALLRRARRGTRRALLRERTRSRGGTGAIAIRLDPARALPVAPAERETVRAALDAFAAGPAAIDGAADFYQVLDVARRVAGLGSLGVPRYVVLVHGRGAPWRHALLDVKAARPSVLVTSGVSASARPDARRELWPTEAERVVAVQRRMQAVPPARLAPLAVAGAPFVLRELQPSEDRVALAQVRGARRVVRFMETLGRVMAWAQLRSAGRGGSATADELREWGASLDGTLVSALDQDADDRRAETERQWRAFAEGYAARPR